MAKMVKFIGEPTGDPPRLSVDDDILTKSAKEGNKRDFNVHTPQR